MKVVEILEKIKSTSKSTEKLSIMKEHAANLHFKSALHYSSNPFKPFHVSTVPRVKANDKLSSILSEEDSWNSFFDLLNRCASRQVTGNEAINLLVSHFRSVDKENEKWMRKILKKHLAIGVSVKSINKAFPGFIPTFEVSLAQKFDEKRLRGRTKVGVEPKLDGIRCFTVIEGDNAIMLARSGKPITNFNDTILKEVKKMGDGCYDGELMGEDFTSLMRQAYRKEDADTTGTYLALFDFLPIEEWNSKKSKMSCEERYENLFDRLDLHNIDLNLVRPVRRVISSCDYDEIKADHDSFVAEGYEGAMIKFLDAPYKFGRGYEVMKLKAFHDVDLPITGLLEGTGKHAGKLGSFQVVYQGVEVQVGSGLTDDLREAIWADQENFLGRIIEVRYQEVTPDGSLRFPTFVCFRNDRN